MTKIVAESREEFDRLEGLAQKLFENFVIEGTSVIIQEGILDRVSFSPDKLGSINRIYSRQDKSSNGKLMDVTPDYVVVEVNGQEYEIKYKPKE